MTSEAKVRDRRSVALAVVVGSVLAAYAGGAAALEFELDDGTRINWNTTLSVGSSWRASDPSRYLYDRGDGSLIGLSSGPLPPGTAPGPKDGLAGNQAAASGNLNYAKGDAFSTPFKLLSDVEIKKGDFGGLLRIKAWYDEALKNNKVLVGNQPNNYNGTRPQLGPYPPCIPSLPTTGNCLPTSPPGQNVWPKQKLSDYGFEPEQKFDNLMLLDAYLYGTFHLSNSDLQVRLGNQVVNWGESIFIQGVNQINPIDVPAARRAGAELKEILLPVWMAYGNWGFNFGSVEAFYQLKWNNTSIDGCGTYWSVTETVISTRPGHCNSATVFNSVMGGPVPGVTAQIVPQLGSNPWAQANGIYVPLVKGKDAKDSGQYGVAFRFPVDKIDTEFGLYAMNIHSRLPMISGKGGTNPAQLSAADRAKLAAAGLIGQDAIGYYWKLGTSQLRNPAPIHQWAAALLPGGGVQITSGRSFWEYPEDIKIFGLSAATNLFGWSVSAEASYSKDVPVQINGNDLLQSLLAGIGPNAKRGLEAAAKGADAYLRGYDRFDKQQFQVNTVKTFSNILGAQNLLIVGEVGMQKNNLPDYTKGAVRYGRGFMFGVGSNQDLAEQSPITGGNTCSPLLVNGPIPIPSPVYNPSPTGCKNDGYVTDYSWGYRLRVSADYNNVLNSGVTVTPSVFWSQDVNGVSMDPTFIEGRKTLGLGLKFNYNKKYTVEANWVNYANADYDPLFDRDYYSVSASVTF